jgi:hypothetical protein
VRGPRDGKLAVTGNFAIPVGKETIAFRFGGNGVVSFPRNGIRQKSCKKRQESFTVMSISGWLERLTGESKKGEGRKQMQYLMLIYHTEKQWAALAETEKQKVYGGFRELREDLSGKDKFIGGNALQPTSTAATVRLRNGQKSVTDGPFAETKEQLGGYILVDASDQEEALAIAARIPIAKTGSIEVRPVAPRVE